MKFTMTIDSDNEACQRRHEIADIIAYVERKVRSGHESGKLFDSNGNSVGNWTLEENEDPDLLPEENLQEKCIAYHCHNLVPAGTDFCPDHQDD